MQRHGRSEEPLKSLCWLCQAADRSSIVRKQQIVKLRGQASALGLHTFRITHAGLQGLVSFAIIFSFDRAWIYNDLRLR